MLKSIINVVKSFLGNFYRHLAIFFRSHWGRPIFSKDQQNFDKSGQRKTRSIEVNKKSIIYFEKSANSGLLLSTFNQIFYTTNCKLQSRSPGLVVMGGDSRSKGCEFESGPPILDGYFFTYLFVMCVWKDEINEKEAGVSPVFLKKLLTSARFDLILL